MKARYRKLEKMLGEDFGGKISNVKCARIKVSGDPDYCPHCFPHCEETVNSKYDKDLKCWKRYRKTQYRAA